jgi:homoserine O-acetyltransferase
METIKKTEVKTANPRKVDLFKYTDEFKLESGRSIPELEIAYETHGTLNSDKSNAILVCHALSGSAHAAGEAMYPDFMVQHTPLLKFINGDTPGWWKEMIGPQRVFNTDKYFIISSNIIGSCYGSSGPLSINPQTGKAYGPQFPQVTVRDMVRAQQLLLQHLGVQKLLLISGGSLGGMQVLEWALTFPDKVQSIVPIATAARHSDWSIGLNHLARQAILNDPVFKEGYYNTQPEKGLSLARKVGMISYRTDKNFNGRFNYERLGDNQDAFEAHNSFQVESYLNYQGEKFVKRFDANSFMQLSNAMDLHDVSRGRGTLQEVLGSIKIPALCIGIDTDVLYPAHEQQNIASSIPHARYAEIRSDYGHDAFLIEFEQMGRIITPFLEESR